MWASLDNDFDCSCKFQAINIEMVNIYTDLGYSRYFQDLPKPYCFIYLQMLFSKTEGFGVYRFQPVTSFIDYFTLKDHHFACKNLRFPEKSESF